MHHHHHHQTHLIHTPKISFPTIKRPHMGKIHTVSFKEFINGTNSVIKSVTEPTRDLIHGFDHGFSSFGKGIGSVGQSLTTPLLIIGGVALVYFVTKK